MVEPPAGTADIDMSDEEIMNDIDIDVEGLFSPTSTPLRLNSLPTPFSDSAKREVAVADAQAAEEESDEEEQVPEEPKPKTKNVQEFELLRTQKGQTNVVSSPPAALRKCGG